MSDLIEVKGIGKAMEAKLLLEGINSIKTLVETLPIKYDTKYISEFSEAKITEEITLAGMIHTEAKVFYIRKRLTKLSFQFNVQNVIFTVSIFNREFMRSLLKKDAQIVVTGKFLHNYQQFVASEIVLRSRFVEGIIPIYRLKNLSSHQFHKLVLNSLDTYVEQIQENLPEQLLKKYELVGRRELFSIVHQPKTDQDVIKASQRIKYEEFLLFALKIAALKKMSQRIVKTPKKYSIDKVKTFINTLPYELTDDQKQATNEIFRDLLAKKPMNRLLQGDVGSGKTICAMIASLAVASANEQIAFMAPTEILAFQHYQTFSRLLKAQDLNIAFLSSNVTGSEREKVMHDLHTGNIQIIIGTHALIQEDISFQKLGFVIIDEQHRFGVGQRKILREKGITPDVLFMSATPIPRTLAITMFGDMDISSIKTIPSGRKKILTKVLDYELMDKVYQRTITELDKGHQAYFIVPLIDESDKSSLLSAKEFYQEIQTHLPKHYKVGLLHGKMKGEEKANILNAFYTNKISALVSTTVVEVGLNVPNATVMVVMNASRFGLSQLHQLRGRVGRDKDQAYCFFVIDDALEGFDKLEILEKTTDGFEISEADLRMRGPGEVFGEEQTGIPRFIMANIVTDQELLEKAIDDAKEVILSNDNASRKLVNQIIPSIDSYNLN